MRQSGGSIAVITVVLLAVITVIFVFQVVLQTTTETFPEVPEGTDLAVVGGGTAALMVALEAAEKGAHVSLFPHGQELGDDCFFLFVEGLAAAGTPPQEAMGLEFTPAELKGLIRQQGGDISTPLLLEHFANDAEYFYFWAEERGGVSFDYLPLPERKPYLHFSSSPAPGAAIAFKERLLGELERSGVILRSEKVREINFSPEGSVKSLLLEDEEGKTAPLYLQAIVLADGGYSGDIARWHEFFPTGANYIHLRPSQEGYGLQLAAAQGADVIQTGFINKRIILYLPQNGEHLPLPEWTWENALFVNTEGEILKGSDFTTDQIFSFVLRSPADEVYIIMSEERVLDLGAPGFFRRFEELEEVAEAYLLAEHRELQEAGAPPPPYYLAPVKSGVDYTLGGLAVTPHGEVKRRGNVITGLFAAGEIVGGLHGEAMLPGMPFSETLFLSRAAGRAAAEYARR